MRKDVSSIEAGSVNFKNAGDAHVEKLTVNNIFNQPHTPRSIPEISRVLREGYERNIQSQPLLLNALQYYVPLDASLFPLSGDKTQRHDQRKPLDEFWIQNFLNDKGNF